MAVGTRNKYKEIEKLIGYKFKKKSVIEMALTHRSYRFERRGVAIDNQRLEFLGDAVLGFLTAAYLYKRFKNRQEGVLTSFRSQTTSGRALAKVAKKIDLGRFIRMGKGEEQSGGRKRASNLADCLEAVLGAAYQDGGNKAAEKVFRKLFVPVLKSLNEDVWAGNPKGKLQEYSQRKWKQGPRYSEVRRHGPAHAAIFTIEVVLGNGMKGRGRGSNKQKAEAEAAAAVLEKLRGAGKISDV